MALAFLFVIGLVLFELVALLFAANTRDGEDWEVHQTRPTAR
jgi:hypothetical protein